MTVEHNETLAKRYVEELAAASSRSRTRSCERLRVSRFTAPASWGSHAHVENMLKPVLEDWHGEPSCWRFAMAS
jgi:hypothetical protein